MHTILRSITDSRLSRLLLLSVLFVGLFSASVGCSGAGTNGGESGEETEEQDAPTAPANLTATSSDSEITLSWDAVDAADTYNVYRSSASTDGAEGSPTYEDVSEASYTDTSAENGTAYYYRVTAVGNEGTESDASNEVKKTPFSDPPDRP